MFSIYKHLAKVLIDPESTHSFISHAFALCLKVNPIPLNWISATSTVMNNILYADVVYKSCTIKVANRELEVDLTLLNIKNFEIILRIDWLTSYLTNVDYISKILNKEHFLFKKLLIFLSYNTRILKTMKKCFRKINVIKMFFSFMDYSNMFDSERE